MDTARVHAVIATTLGDADLAGLGPLTLRVGQRLLAEVLSIQAETGRTILSLAGRRIEAQVPTGIRQGEIVRLVVAEVVANRVTFRVEPAPVESAGAGARPALGVAVSPPPVSPLAAPPTPALGTPGISVAPRVIAPPLDGAHVLAELDLPDSPASRAVVQALVERQQPLTRDAVQQLRAAIAGLPGPLEPDARAAALLRAEGLPLTARAVQLARTSLTPASAAPLGMLLGELVATLRAAAGAPMAAPEAPAKTAPRRSSTGLIADMTDVPTAEPPADVPEALPQGPPTPGAGTQRRGAPDPALTALSLAVSAPEAAELERVFTLFTRTPEAALLANSRSILVVSRLAEAEQPPSLIPPADQASDTPSSSARPPLDVPPAPTDDATQQNARTILLSIVDDPAEAPETARATLPEARAVVSERVREMVAALHDRVELEQLRAAGVTRGAAVSQTTGLLEAQGDPFAPAGPTAPAVPAPALPPATLPSHPIALSIPLAIGGQFATLQLHVQREPEGGNRSPSDAPAAIRASFTLHLRRLGEVGADLRLAGPQVRCRLRAASPDVATRLSEGMSGLQARLEADGLDVRQMDCVLADAGAQGDAAPRVQLRHVAAEA